MAKFAAWGGNVIVRVRNPNYSEGGILLNTEKQNISLDTEGVVCSTGYKVTRGEELINRVIRFNHNMVMDIQGEESSPHLFVLIPEAGILSVSLEESEVVSLQ